MHGSTQQQISSNRSGYALGVRGLRRLTLSESPVPVFGINHDMKSLFSMRTWTSEPSCRPSKKDGRPSAPSDASRGVSEISPRAGRRLHVPNAPPSVVEARPNRNALRRRKEHTRGDTDSRPARRQGPLVHGLSGPVTTNSGKGSPSRAWDKTAGCTRSALKKISSQE